MSRLGRLSQWLGRSRRRAQRNTEERIKRLRRWFHRPLLEQLEDRLMPGSIVVGISELLHGGANDPFAEVPEVVTPPGLPERVEPAGHDNQDPWPIYVAPQAPPLPSTAGQDIFATPDKQDDAITSSTSRVDTSDWRGSVFDGDLFRALDDVFGGPAGGAPQEFSTPGPLDSGGGQAGDPGGGGAGLPSAGDGGGGSTSPMMVSNSSDYGGAPYTSSSGGGAGTYNSTSSASPTSPLLPPTASSSPAKPAPIVTPQSTAGTSLVHTVAPPVAPLTTDHPPPTTTPLTTHDSPLTLSPPVLTTVQPLGAAEQGHLFVQGTLSTKEPAGTMLHVDIFGRAPGDTGADGILLGSVTANVKAPGTVPFQGVIKADVPAGEPVVAALHSFVGQTFPSAASNQWSRALTVPSVSALDAKGIPLGLEDLGPNHGDANNDGLHDASQPEVATLPIATTGAFATLVAAGHALEHVQVSEPPQTATSFPWGLFNFDVTHVPVGGSAVVKLILPAGAAPSSYYKEDPTTGALMPFLYDGKTGAQIQGNAIMLHLVDGGPGDLDGVANGVIVDPSGPGSGGTSSWSTPLLQAAQPYGDAGPGRLFVEGSVTSTAPIGATAQVNFLAVDASGLGTTPLGSTTVTQTGGQGPIAFRAVLKADVAPGSSVVAVIAGANGTNVQSASVLPGSKVEDMHGIPIALEALGPNNGDGNNDGILDALQPDVASLPVVTTGEFVTLEAPGAVLRNVQVMDAPVTGVTLPWGLMNFKVDGVLPGGSATVRFVLPKGSYPSRYIKQDPLTGLLTNFTGAVIDGNVVTLTLVDGGSADTDGLANGEIVDPGSPGAGTITIPCDNGLTGWTVFQTGGSGGGVGTVTYSNSNFVITEGNSFDVGLKHDFTIPTTPTILTFDYSNLNFATTSTGRIKDAFEAAFVDASGNSLVQTIGLGRNAFFNITEGMQPALAPGVTVQNGQVNLDISKLFAGTTGTLVFRLVNNDSDTTSTVSISCHQPPIVTEALANDTAPTGPGTDVYRTDLLTNDPTVTGTAKDAAGIIKVEASVDGGAYIDITSTLNLDQYTWYPGALTAGSHTISIRATDTAQQVTTVSLTFRVNVPPVADAGGNQTINEGSAAIFDASLSSDTEAAPFSYLWTFPSNSTASGSYASFTFAQDGTYSVPVAVTDTAGSVVSSTAIITVVNLPAVITTIPDQTVNEAATAAFQTGFTDNGVLDTHTATIDWGDASTGSGTISESGGMGTVSGSHVYLEEGLFTVKVTVTDNGGAAATASCIVAVNDVPPTLTIGGSSSVNEGTSYVLTLGATRDPIRSPAGRSPGATAPRARPERARPRPAMSTATARSSTPSPPRAPRMTAP